MKWRRLCCRIIFTIAKIPIYAFIGIAVSPVLAVMLAYKKITDEIEEYRYE